MVEIAERRNGAETRDGETQPTGNEPGGGGPRITLGDSEESPTVSSNGETSESPGDYQIAVGAERLRKSSRQVAAKGKEAGSIVGRTAEARPPAPLAFKVREAAEVRPVNPRKSSGPFDERGYFLPGTNFRNGEYSFIQHLKDGGMASIYKGRDLGFNRYVAIKVLTGRGAKERAWRERFELEGRLLANVNSENVVKVYWAGFDHGRQILVMELLNGDTLDEYIKRRGKLTEDEVVEITKKMCRGVGALHARGIVHRDLKPKNIFIAQTDDGLEVKIFDLGVAKRLTSKLTDRDSSEPDAAKSVNGGLTQAESIVGTPGYMSPEQTLHPEAVNAKTDQYNLGLILFEMLTGQRAFSGSPLAIAHKVAIGKVAPIASLRPDVSLALVAIAERAMRVNETERFESVDEMGLQLEQLGAGAGGRRPFGRTFSTPRTIVPQSSMPIPMGAARPAPISEQASAGAGPGASGASPSSNTEILPGGYGLPVPGGTRTALPELASREEGDDLAVAEPFEGSVPACQLERPLPGRAASPLPAKSSEDESVPSQGEARRFRDAAKSRRTPQHVLAVDMTARRGKSWYAALGIGAACGFAIVFLLASRSGGSPKPGRAVPSGSLGQTSEAVAPVLTAEPPILEAPAAAPPAALPVATGADSPSLQDRAQPAAEPSPAAPIPDHKPVHRKRRVKLTRNNAPIL